MRERVRKTNRSENKKYAVEHAERQTYKINTHMQLFIFGNDVMTLTNIVNKQF